MIDLITSGTGLTCQPPNADNMKASEKPLG